MNHMFNKTTRIHVQGPAFSHATPWGDRVNLYMVQENDGHGWEAQAVWAPVEDELGSLATAAPFVSLTPTAAQALMDSLWDSGMRPTEGKGSAGSFAAQGEHLKDMKAFNDRLLQMIERLP